MASFEAPVTPMAYVLSIKDKLLEASIKAGKALEPKSDIGLVCWHSDGTEIFSHGGMFANFARGKCKAVRRHGLKYGFKNALKYVRDPTQGVFPLCFFLCCIVPNYLCCTGQLNVIGVTMFKVNDEYFIYAGSGATAPSNDVKTPEGGLVELGFVKNEDGIFAITIPTA